MIRKLVWSLLLLLPLITAPPLKAQMVDNELGRNFIYASPFHLFDGNMYVSLERFNKTFAKSFVLNTGVISRADEKRTAGILLHPEVRKYYLSNYLKYDTAGLDWKLKGVYAGLFAHLSYLHEDYRQEEILPGGVIHYEYINTSYRSYGFGTTIGLMATLYQWMYFNVYIGGGIKFTQVTNAVPGNEEDNPSIYSPAYEGIFPRIGIQLGINF